MAKRKSQIKSKSNFGEGVDKVMAVLSDRMKKSGVLNEEGKVEIQGAKKILEKEVNQVIAIAKQIKINWKTTLPAIAAVGAGAYLLRKQSKKKAAKKTAKKAPAKAKSKAKKK